MASSLAPVAPVFFFDADEPKRQAAFRRLGDEAEEQRLREEKAYHYVCWTFFAAIAAVIVGLIGVGLSLSMRQ